MRALGKCQRCGKIGDMVSPSLCATCRVYNRKQSIIYSTSIKGKEHRKCIDAKRKLLGNAGHRSKWALENKKAREAKAAERIQSWSQESVAK